MVSPPNTRGVIDVDQYLEAFESAYRQEHDVDFRRFLPSREHPHYHPILKEFIRVDLEYRWMKGETKYLEDYQEQFPGLFRERDLVREMAFEEFRLRRLNGENPSLLTYEDRFGLHPKELEPRIEESARDRGVGPLDNKRLEDDSGKTVTVDNHDQMEAAAAAYQEFRESQTANKADGGPLPTVLLNHAAGQYFHDLHQANPQTALRVAQAVTSMPEIGGEFAGFHLLDELGKGAFGRVFLARQHRLAQRLVALKISSEFSGESQTLAQLQHTNIVPIFSIHNVRELHAVCMPYLGSTTLVDILKGLQGRDGLPLSGNHFVSTLRNQFKTVTHSSSSPSVSSEPGEAKAAISSKDVDVSVERSASPGQSTVILEHLNQLSYVEAILFLGARLADGLAHAHEHGILHRDLKPANILLTDEGQPMLLDFNLSKDTKARGSAAGASIGGTLPYMAPEHLAAFRDRTEAADPRSDIYSLGIILYELLSGQCPFPLRKGAPRAILEVMIADRQKALRGLRSLNPSISPAMESIIRHCLEPRPEDRYQTARDLKEDLDRQLAHLPLKFAPEPSGRERMRKWIRRHPRLTSSSSVALIGLAVIVILSVSLVGRSQHLARLTAQESFRDFQHKLHIAQISLYGQSADQEHLDAGLHQCREALDQYEVLDRPSWTDLPRVQNLPEAARDDLRNDVSELLFLSARALSSRALDLANAAEKEKDLALALSFNQTAANHCAPEEMPRALWQQRGELLARLGRKSEADGLFKNADKTPLRTARDYYLSAQLLAKEGNYRKALPLLEQATQLDPRSFSAWFVKGNCFDSLMRCAEAAACYSTCIALRPDFHWGWFNRGLARLRQNLFTEACADFDQALTLDSGHAEGFLNRALAQEGLGHFDLAIDDFTKAIDRGTPETQVYFLRAIVREKAGDQLGAKEDREKGLRLQPHDEGGWNARGLARLESDPNGALADFNEALNINPSSAAALQNKAHVLGERMHKDHEAVEILNQAVARYPDWVLPRAGRGVHLARLGKWPAAIQDAQEALVLDTEPPNLYQVACIYALTSRQNPEDRLRAFELLSRALKGGFGLDVVDQDTDLDPLRKQDEFQKIVKAAKALAPSRPGSPQR